MHIDHGPTNARNVLAVVLGIKYDKYKLGIDQGILHGYYSFYQLFKASRTPTLSIENIIEEKTKASRGIAKPHSRTCRQGFPAKELVRRTNANNPKYLCNSRCH